MKYLNRQYNEKQLAVIAKATKASREEILEVIRLSNIKLEEIAECILKNKAILHAAN